ncbi:TPA: FAD-dependent oxidoreductase [Candidatus Woesearchaeota archaeon]|nr:FAD-dependent oxidoreductase [Candidatus Woesearchaeota archaeon]HII64123.1 FAD-dependent oxidoreductase [Candidatus Woesearchaeota archaeon]HIJ18431.1 FAD-dependent oxidoreductase [Candidatus Woesearchaeota archaeon]
MDVKSQNHYDFLIIGAGGTGLSAAMYAARMNLKTLVLGASSGAELPIGGIITLTDVVENYPGFIRLTGTELAQKIEEHAKSYPQVTVKEDRATEIRKDGQFFAIKTGEGKTYTAATLLFATGAKWRELPMKGAEEFKNRGVHYCALCDGPVYSGKTVCVVGGSDSAAKEALFLAQHAKKVYIIYRGEEIRPEPHNAKLIAKEKKIAVVNRTNVTEIRGEKLVKSVVLDRAFEGRKELQMDGVFGAIGHIPLSDLAKAMGVAINKKNEIVINRDSSTSLPGVFAAGDVVDSGFKQLITGVAEGVIASHSAFEYIKKSEIPMALE